MVTKRHHLKSHAFTLIELIFAIVIVAISVLSLPMMSQESSRSIENSITQEAIFAASAELMGASSGYWDLNSMEDNNVSHLSRVIDVIGDCDNNNTSDRFRLRDGHIQQPLHRRCVVSASGDVNNTADATFVNLNNAAHANANIFTDAITDPAGYKETYQSNVTVDDQNNSIKLITINVVQPDGTLVTTLRMQSANIGEIDFLRGDFSEESFCFYYD